MSASTEFRRFAPGPWYAVTGAEVTVLLPPTEQARVAGLWQLADSGADADALLDALVAGGIRGLGELVLLATTGDTVRLLVRGSADVRVASDAGEEIITVPAGTVWIERVLAGVSAVHVALTSDAAPTDLPLLPGIAGVSAVSLGDHDRPASPAGQHAHALVEEPESEPEPVDPEPVEPADTDPEDADLEDAEVLEASAAVGPQDAGSDEQMPLADPVEGAAPEPVEAAAPEDGPTDSAWSDRDGQTIVGDQPEAFTRPEIPGQEHAPDVLSRPVARLVFSTGDVVEVDRTVLVGRAPEARRFTSAEQPRLVTVDSPHQEISSTHLEVRPGAGADHGSAVVTDLGSTNGTVLVQPGLPPEDLQPGIAVCLVPGAILDLGDGVTISTTKP